MARLRRPGQDERLPVPGLRRGRRTRARSTSEGLSLVGLLPRLDVQRPELALDLLLLGAVFGIGPGAPVLLEQLPVTLVAFVPRLFSPHQALDKSRLARGVALVDALCQIPPD